MTAWDPAQYNRFAAEREQPFWDLAALLRPAPGATLVDLGCGDGRLTRALAARLGAARATGLDNSPAMLAAATGRAAATEPAAATGLAATDRDTVTFARADIGTWTSGGDVDVVFSNAALQWVPDHPAVLGRWTAALRPGGQLAVQVPANADHPSHTVSRQLGEERLGRRAPVDPVEAHVEKPEVYAELLHQLGFEEQHVRLQVYGHVLDSAADVVEWVKGTSLTRFRAVMAADEYEAFLDEYGRRLRAELGEHRPYFYPFKRILLWGRLRGS